MSVPAARTQVMTDFSTYSGFELTRDMVESLAQYFDLFAEDDVIRIVKDNKGLWFVSAERRVFLGLARLPASKQRRLN